MDDELNTLKSRIKNLEYEKRLNLIQYQKSFAEHIQNKLASGRKALLTYHVRNLFYEKVIDFQGYGKEDYNIFCTKAYNKFLRDGNHDFKVRPVAPLIRKVLDSRMPHTTSGIKNLRVVSSDGGLQDTNSLTSGSIYAFNSNIAMEYIDDHVSKLPVSFKGTYEISFDSFEEDLLSKIRDSDIFEKEGMLFLRKNLIYKFDLIP